MRKFTPFSLNLRGRLVEVTRPQVMGIVNITPDSFYSSSRTSTAGEVSRRVASMIADGADIIDLGACSTRPGAAPVSADEELRRLEEGMKGIRSVAPDVIVSIDTFRADVARRAVEELGGDMINDISGGDLDPAMADTVARLRVPYVMMHTRGTPETMTSMTGYSDVTAEVLAECAGKLARLRQTGVSDVIVDPGFGFAKTVEQNYELLARLEIFHILEAPLLVGISRKSMIYKPLGLTPDEALTGTTVLDTVALAAGAAFIRVHDPRQAAESVKLITLLTATL